MSAIGNAISIPFQKVLISIPSTVQSQIEYWLGVTVGTAVYPNKIGDQDRVELGGEVFPGRANAFDGTNQYAYVADNGALDINQATTDFCLSGWAKANADGNIEYLFGKNLDNTITGRYGFLKPATNIVRFQFYTSTGLVNIDTSIDGDSDTDWHLFTARIDLSGSKVYVYTDGVLENPGGTSFTGTLATLANAYEFYLAARSNIDGSSTSG